MITCGEILFPVGAERVSTGERTATASGRPGPPSYSNVVLTIGPVLRGIVVGRTFVATLLIAQLLSALGRHPEKDGNAKLL